MAGHVRRESMVFGQVAHRPPRFGFAGIPAEDHGAARGGMRAREQQLDECGLARSVRSQKSERGTALHVERNSIHRPNFFAGPAVSKYLDQAFRLDRAGHPLGGTPKLLYGFTLLWTNADRRAPALLGHSALQLPLDASRISIAP